MKIFKKIFTFTLFFYLQNSLGFVENVVNGYPNCMACHISPTGGGILTDYGRSLSSELMSTVKTKKFHKPFYGLVNNSEFIKWGGQFRSIQTRYEDNKAKRGTGFIMQNNIEAAAYIKDFVFVGTVGTQEGPKDRVPKKGNFVSERHYLLWNTDQTTRIKVGKFRQNYGLNDPNHTRFNKQNLGFGSNTETYQLEFFKFFENAEAIFSTSIGRIDIPESSVNERNIMGQYTHYLNGKSRLTGNMLLGESTSQRRSLYGINGVFPVFSKRNFFKFQLDYQITRSTIGDTKQDNGHGLYGNIVFGRKLFEGFLPYLVYEQQQTDLDQSRLSLTTSPGIGFQWFPLSHFEIQLEHQYRTAYLTKDNPSHRTFVVLHLYH